MRASGVSEAGEVSQPVQAKRAGAGGPVQADRTVKDQAPQKIIPCPQKYFANCLAS